MGGLGRSILFFWLAAKVKLWGEGQAVEGRLDNSDILMEAKESVFLEAKPSFSSALIHRFMSTISFAPNLMMQQSSLHSNTVHRLNFLWKEEVIQFITRTSYRHQKLFLFFYFFLGVLFLDSMGFIVRELCYWAHQSLASRSHGSLVRAERSLINIQQILDVFVSPAA